MAFESFLASLEANGTQTSQKEVRLLNTTVKGDAVGYSKLAKKLSKYHRRGIFEEGRDMGGGAFFYDPSPGSST